MPQEDDARLENAPLSVLGIQQLFDMGAILS